MKLTNNSAIKEEAESSKKRKKRQQQQRKNKHMNKMRFINCPNCLSSSHTDDHLERKPSAHGRHRKFGRLHTFTKALFSPNRHSFNAPQKSNGFTLCMKSTAPTAAGNIDTIDTSANNQNNNNNNNDSTSDEMTSQSPPSFKYRLERKHKIKKRDLLKQQHKRESNATGKSLN